MWVWEDEAVDDEPWIEQMEKEIARRKKAKKFKTLSQLRKEHDVIFAGWEDYHKGDCSTLMSLLEQTGYKHAAELGLFQMESFHGDYLFCYSKKALSKKKLKAIEYALGIDLKRKYNLDDWCI
jgi:hypothetical protein